MRTWEQFIDDKVMTSDMQEIIANYEKLQADGSIGVCELRRLANVWDDETGCGSVTTVMQSIAMECYKYYAHRYLELRK